MCIDIHLPTLVASISFPTPTPGDTEQEVMLTTKTPKATVGGLSPSKGYTVQIFELTRSGNSLLAQREFVSKSVILHKEPSLRVGVCVEGSCGSPHDPPSPAATLGWGTPTAPRISLQLRI